MHRLPSKLTLSAALLTIASLLACTSATEPSEPTAVDAAPPAATDGGALGEPTAGKAKGRKGKAGKGGKGGKRPPAASGACPEGVIASPSWPGEWPSPVVDVTKPVAVSVRTEPCGKATLTCTVPVGIYHPWSKIESEYLTVRGIDRYEVIKAATIGERPVAVGDIVEVVQYFGEGFCGYRIAGAEAEDSCPEILDGSPLKQIPGPTVAEVELFSVSCDGKTGWVEATDALLALPEVRPGTTPDWGSVGPGTE